MTLVHILICAVCLLVFLCLFLVYKLWMGHYKYHAALWLLRKAVPNNDDLDVLADEMRMDLAVDWIKPAKHRKHKERIN